jgi:acylphosphatase
MPDERIRRRVVVHGRVQGVFFRDSVRRRAAAAGVAGWVRNREDGTVEAVFEGPASAVEALVAFAQRGPARAVVERVDLEDEAPRGERGFNVR